MRLTLFLCVPALLAGCAAWRGAMPPVPLPAPVAQAPAGSQIDTIPFRTGVSSATVERMARERACTGGLGAGLITATGPVEVYRMRCDDGRVFMARCELRQCKAM